MMVAPFRFRRLVMVSLFAATTFTVACSKLTEANPTVNRYGAVNITARGSSASSASASATVIFFEAFSAAVPSSVLQATDQCAYSTVDTTKSFPSGVKKAGDQVTLSIGANTVTLPYESGLFRYANVATSPFTYRSGDAVVANIPGSTDGFPSASISVRLAETLIPGAVAIPAPGAPLAVTWNASTDTTAAILLSLRYNNPTTSSYPNEQIYCSLKDDGKFDIPASGLTAFLAAPNASRSLRMTRWRTRESLLDPKTMLHIATSIDTTVKFP